MTLTPRPYRNINDFYHLDAVLTSGGRGAGVPYYIHPGDVRWWLFYTFPDYDPFRWLTLWEDERGRPAAWTLFSEPETALDVFCLPKIHAGPELQRLIGWGVERMTGILRQSGETRLYKWWNHPEDQALLSVLDSFGFTPSGDVTLTLTRSLERPIPQAKLPAGYRLRSARGLAELENRAAVQHSAFESDVPMERYLQRFRRYLASPAYSPEQDVVVEAPDGSLAAFARIWLDPFTRVGNFEPVGTHQGHQRRGLGRAVMLEGLRRLRDQGMTMAKVSTGETNQPAICLYEQVGFEIAVRLPTYARVID